MTDLSVRIDESEKGNLLVIGGLIARWQQIPGLVAEWRNVKVSAGLEPHTEIKWNLPSNHQTRVALNKLGITTRALSEKFIKFLVSTDTICVATAMADKRSDIELWKKFFWEKASARDFFCEGVRYVVQRVAEECVDRKTNNCVIVCDTPELGRHFFQHGSIWRGPAAMYDAYKGWQNSTFIPQY